jgi:hypothetical protein
MYEVIYSAYQGVSFYKDCIPTSLSENKRSSKLSLHIALTDFLISIATGIFDSENTIVWAKSPQTVQQISDYTGQNL